MLGGCRERAPRSPLLLLCSATKAGVILLTKTMALDLAHLGIRCNAVAPGYCLTPLAQAIDPPEFSEWC